MTNQPFFVPAMFIEFMSIPLIFALVPKNRFYGIRIVKTMSDEKIWYRANRFGTLPKAFRHPQLGFVDALIMHKQLVP